MITKMAKITMIIPFLLINFFTVSLAEEDLSRYNITSIPSQTARHGDAFEFLFYWEDGTDADFTWEAEPEPLGPISVVPDTEFNYGCPDCPDCPDCPCTGDCPCCPCLDCPNWRFSYTPDLDDRHPFFVKITGESGSVSISHTFEVQPSAALMPEHTVFGIEEGHTEPQPPSDQYNDEDIDQYKITEITCNGDNGCKTTSLNHLDGTPRLVRIVGGHVEFKSGSEPFDTYHNDTSIGKMEIIAETVSIHDSLHLPQTNVEIFAKDLFFIGENAQIITTPSPYTSRANPDALAQEVYPEDYADPNKRGLRNPTSGQSAGHGLTGLKAGNITLHVENFYSYDEFQDPIYAARFVMKGGRGQDPGNGVPGKTSPFQLSRSKYQNCVYDTCFGWGCTTGCSQSWCASTELPGYWITRAVHYAPSGLPQYSIIDGLDTLDLPKDGTDAKPSGKPGRGGEGGDLKTFADINLYNENFFEDYTAYGFGDPGTKGGVWPGGNGSTPSKAVHIQFNQTVLPFIGYCSWTKRAERATSPGNSKASPGPPSHLISESPGNVDSENAPYAWLHPLLMEWALSAITDAYLRNRIFEAETRMRTYIAVIDAYIDHPALDDLTEDDQFVLLHAYDEMQLLLSQIENNLDYFGNPAGWAPMLSFESYLNNFELEINRSIKSLYLAYWVKTKAQNDNDKVAALETARNELKAELEAAKLKFASQEAEVDALMEKAEILKGAVYQKRLEIQSKEQQLRDEAAEGLREPYWALLTRSGLKGAAMAFSIFPVWQPELGTIGDGIRLISNVDLEKPWETIFEAPDVATKFLNSAYDTSVRDVKTQIEKIKAPKVETNKREYLRNIKESSDGFSKSLKDMREFFSSIEAPKEEVDAELEKLKNQSTDYKQLVEEINTLIKTSTKTARDILYRMQEASMLKNLITANILEIDALNRTISAGEAVMNQNAIRYLENMERRAYDRLLKYHYYLAKAYEYRFLKHFSDPDNPDDEPLQLNLSEDPTNDGSRPGGLMGQFKDIAELNLRTCSGPPAGCCDPPACEDIATGDHTITPEQFDAFRSVYEEIIAIISKRIIKEFSNYQGAGLEKEATLAFNLLPDELDKINKGQAVVLNLVEEGLIPAIRENLRIFELGLWIEEENQQGQHHVETIPIGGDYNPTSTVTFEIRHSGISKFLSDGEVYLFKHFGQNSASSQNPDSRGDAVEILWSGDYQPHPSVDAADNNDVAAHTISLLTNILKVQNDKTMLFSRPAAWADLELTKYVTNTKPNSDIHLTENSFFEITYNFTRMNPDSVFRYLDVLVNIGEVDPSNPGIVVNSAADFKPYFIVTTPESNGDSNGDVDRNGRGDAWGRFMRVFTESYTDEVVIEAQKKYGTWRFRKWTDGDGQDLPGGPITDPIISIPLLPNDDPGAINAVGAQYAAPTLYFDDDLDADLDGLDLLIISETLTDDLESESMLKDFAWNFGFQSSPASTGAPEAMFIKEDDKPFMKRRVIETLK
jgi:hypothetical protein